MNFNLLTFLKWTDPGQNKMASLHEHHSKYVDGVRRHYHVNMKLFLKRSGLNFFLVEKYPLQKTDIFNFSYEQTDRICTEHTSI